MTIERTDAILVGDERTMLREWLDYHRATLAVKCEGLSDDQLRLRSAAPSTMSLVGLVRHMGEVERAWFRRVMPRLSRADGPPPRFYDDQNLDGDFDDVDTADVAEAFAYWREQCDIARDVEKSFASLDECGWEAERGDISLRWVLIHMIEEYARHNGHADLLRERIDGVTGD